MPLSNQRIIKLLSEHRWCSLLLIVALLNGSCSMKNPFAIENYAQYLHQKIDYRDSIYAIYTLEQWRNKSWQFYGEISKTYQLNNSQIKNFIVAPFYSPDRKKIIIWYAEKCPNAKNRCNCSYSKDRKVDWLCNSAGDTIVDVLGLIGIRENINAPFKLYPLENVKTSCYENVNDALSNLCQYYFHEMKDFQMGRMMQSGDRKGHEESSAYQYNIQDKDFWDKCWIWEKDTVGSHGLYVFEIYGYNYNGTKCTPDCADPYNPPVIDYPKEILDLYKQ